MKNILFVILLFLSFSVFGQKWTLGTVPPAGTEQRINQTTQFRKGTKPNQFHITRGDKSVVFMDADTVAQILGIGESKTTKYISLLDTVCTSWNGGYAYMCQDGVGATLTNIVINGITYTINQSLYDGSGNPLPSYNALHTAVLNAITTAGYSSTVSGFDDGGCYEIDFQLTAGNSTLTIDFNWFDGNSNQTTQGQSIPNCIIGSKPLSSIIAEAQANCPALTIAKLESCNVAYLYMFNCEASKWELFKTPNIYTAGKTLFVDEVTGNDATAKKGCPTCTFKTLENASNSAEYSDGDKLEVNAGVYNAASTLFFNDTSAFLHLENGVIINSNVSSGLIGGTATSIINSPVKKTIISGNGELINNGTWVAIKPFNPAGDVKIELDKYSGNQPLCQLNGKNVNIDIKEVIANTYSAIGFFGNQQKSKNDIRVGNMYVFTTNPSAGYQTGIISIETNTQYGDGIQSDNNFNIEIKNLEINRKHGSVLNSQARNYPTELNKNNTYSLYVNNLYQYNKDSLISAYNSLVTFPTRSIVSVNTAGNGVHVEDENIYNVDIKNSVTDYSILCLQSTVDYYRNNKYIIKGNYLVKKLESFYFESIDSLKNSTIIIEGDYTNISGLPLFKISASNLYNTKIILKGNFISTGKILEISGGTADNNTVIELQGKFKTTSTTLPAIDINNSRLFLKDCDIVTGGGFSIDSATPVNVTVKPGCASNVLTSPNVTQLGSTVTVDSNFNN